MSGPHRTVVLSRRAAERRVWLAAQYEFEDVVREVDDAVLLTPAARATGPVGGAAHGAINRARRRVGIARRGRMAPVPAAGPADLFFAVFAAPHEIADLDSVRDQLRVSRRRIAFVVELWSGQVAAAADHLRRLRGFDHVFVFNARVVDAVREITGVPTSYLDYGVDAERFAPRTWAERPNDVTSYGRRAPGGTHAVLVDALEAGRLTYSFDTTQGPFDVIDPREHRVALAATLQRSKFVVVHKIEDVAYKVGAHSGDEMLTSRYFEVTAAGAVLLGSAPDIPEWEAAFGWPDALVPIAQPAPDIEHVLADLEAQPERLARARVANATHALRRHDWAHRWRAVLDVAGMVPLDALGERLERLEERARVLAELPVRA